MAAHIDAQYAKSTRNQRRNLLCPHTGIGGQSVRENDGTPVFRPDQIVMNAPRAGVEKHGGLLAHEAHTRKVNGAAIDRAVPDVNTP
jgi:hypothetical protein